MINMKWALLISLAVRCDSQCAFFDYASDIKEINMNGCGLTSINTTELERFTNLQLLFLQNNSLTTFPDLSPVGGTLKRLKLFGNKLTSINTALLEGLTNLQELNLGGNDLETFPDLLPIADTLKWLGLLSNNIGSMSRELLLSLTNLESLKPGNNINLKHFPHTVNALRNIKELDIHNTGISHLPPILFDNIANVQKLYIHSSVDVCTCENAWLKQEGPKIADFQYDDANCGDQPWSGMAMDDFDKKCKGEKHIKKKNFARAIDVKYKMSLNAFLLHSHEARLSEIKCTRKCLGITGCVSFYWRRLHGRLGDCVIIAPGNFISVGSVPDGNLEVWTYFTVQ